MVDHADAHDGGDGWSSPARLAQAAHVVAVRMRRHGRGHGGRCVGDRCAVLRFGGAPDLHRRILTAGGEVLDVGRRSRTATLAQRRAIIARDQHCRAVVEPLPATARSITSIPGRSAAAPTSIAWCCSVDRIIAASTNRDIEWSSVRERCSPCSCPPGAPPRRDRRAESHPRSVACRGDAGPDEPGDVRQRSAVWQSAAARLASRYFARSDSESLSSSSDLVIDTSLNQPM